MIRTGQKTWPLLAVFILACSSGGRGAPAYTEDIGSLVPDKEENLPTPEVPKPLVVPEPIDVCPDDPCPQVGGVEWRCRSRFVYGTNFAWEQFGTDFGGSQSFSGGGISGNPGKYSARLADMKAHGVNLVRWWMIPDFRGDAVRFDEDGVPIGLGESVLDDITQALELAQVHDVYLMLTIFSFDGFRPWEDRPYMTPIVLDKELRTALLENVVRPIAAHVEKNDYAIRLHSWDLINEPEWAMVGTSLYGDPPYLQEDDIDSVRHEEMEQFLAEMSTVIREESSALISVGTSMKWPQSWTGLDLDFHQLHWYPWMDPNFPLDSTPEDLGLGDKAVVLGEFPAASEYAEDSDYSYAEIMALLQKNGWAGALGWDWGHSTSGNKDAVLAFAEENSCATTY